MKILSRTEMSKLKGGDDSSTSKDKEGAAGCNSTCDNTCKTSDNRDGNCRLRASDQQCFCVAGY